MKNLFLSAIAAVMVLLSGCGTMNELAENPLTHVAVRASVAEFVDGEAVAAQGIINWTDDVMELIKGNPEMLVAELQKQAMDLIPWDDLSGARQVIAIEALAFIQNDLSKRIEAGELPADATVGFRDLLETARWAAEFQLALLE